MNKKYVHDKITLYRKNNRKKIIENKQRILCEEINLLSFLKIVTLHLSKRDEI